MLYPNKNVEDLQKSNKLVSIESQVKTVRSEDELGEQKFHENMEKTFEPVKNSNKHVSEEVTKTMMETSTNNNKALENLKNNFLEIMNERGILASFLMSPLSKITNPETTTQFETVKTSSSNRVNDLLIKNIIPVTLQNNLLTFRDTGKVFELKRDLLKKKTNKIYIVDLASLADKKLKYDFAKEMHFVVRGQGRKSTRYRTLMKLMKSPTIMASGNSNTFFLSSVSNELCNRLRIFLQVKHAGNNSDLFNEEIVAILDNLLEYKCISKKQHKQILNKCNLLHI